MSVKFRELIIVEISFYKQNFLLIHSLNLVFVE